MYLDTLAKNRLQQITEGTPHLVGALIVADMLTSHKINNAQIMASP